MDSKKSPCFLKKKGTANDKATVLGRYACAGSHRQSEMEAMGPNAPAYMSPGWQNPQNMQIMVTCALLVASSTC